MPSADTEERERARVIARAMTLVNDRTPYVWDGLSKFGADCSGLVKIAYRGLVNLPHKASEQQTYGHRVAKDNLRPGDLLFYGAKAHHVAIYLGGDKMIEEEEPGTVAHVTKVRPFTEARDLIGGPAVTGKPVAASASHVSDEQAIYTYFDHYFRGKGFTTRQAQIAASGALGNIKVESGFSPTAYNPREGAIGLEQWENGRRTALDAYAKRHHESPTALATQLHFSTHELNGSYGSVIGELRHAPTAATAAGDWSRVVEGNTPASDGARAAAATQIYARVRSGKKLTGGGHVHTVAQQAGGSNDVTETSFLSDLSPSKLGSAIESGISGALTDIARPFARFAADAALVLLGLGLLIAGVVILAKSADSPSSSPPPTAAGEQRKAHEQDGPKSASLMSDTDAVAAA